MFVSAHEVRLWVFSADPYSAPEGRRSDGVVGRARDIPINELDGRSKCRSIARKFLARHIGVAPDELRITTRCRYCGSAHGKPVIEWPKVNLSHSFACRGGVGVLAASELEVGVDIEVIAGFDFWNEVARIAMTEREFSIWSESPTAMRAEMASRLWARKESVLKASGYGLARSPASIDMIDDTVVLSANSNMPETWHVKDVTGLRHFVVAAASAGPMELQTSFHLAHEALEVERPRL